MSHMVLWKKGKNVSAAVQVLIAHLQERRKGNLLPVKLALYHEFVALTALLDWKCPLSDSDKADMMWAVLEDIGSQPTVTENSFLNALNLALQKRMGNGEQHYVIYTYLSIGHSVKAPRRRIGKATVIITPNPPPRFRKANLQILNKARFPDAETIADLYQSVRVYVSAPTFATAVARAEDAVDLLRACWNLRINRASGVRWTLDGGQRPVNKITAIPIYSVHDKTGNLSTEMYWYEPSGERLTLPVMTDTAMFQQALKEEMFWREKLKRAQDPAELESALRRYVRAFDTSDWAFSFLQLWGLLEYLTHVKPGDGHELVVKRSTALLTPGSSKDLAVLVMDAMRQQRNHFVHSSEFTPEAEAFMYSLKFFVEHMLIFHLQNRFRFGSIQEAVAVLDIPKEVDALNRSMEEMRRQTQQLEKRWRLAKRVAESWTAHGNP